MTYSPFLMWQIVFLTSWVLLVMLPWGISFFLPDGYVKYLYNNHKDLWGTLGQPSGQFWMPQEYRGWHNRSALAKLILHIVIGKHHAPIDDPRAVTLCRRYRVVWVICAHAALMQ